VTVNEFRPTPLGSLVSIRTGKLNSNASTTDGKFPFFTCSRETFRTDAFAFDTEAVILAGNNAAGIFPIKYFVGKFNAYQRTYVLETVDPDQLLNRYCFYVLQPQLAFLRTVSTGATTKFLTLGILSNLELLIPSLKTQTQIVSVLGAFDDLIENNRRRIGILEEMARLLYREWFVHFRFPGHEDVELVDSELGPIPEGWEVGCLAAVCELKKHNVRPQDHQAETFLHYSIPAFDETRLPTEELGETIRSGKYELGDCVLLSKLNPRFPRVWRSPGPYAYRAVCSTEFLVLEEIEDGWPLDFVRAVVSDLDFASRLAQMAGGTSTSHQRVRPGDVMNLPIVVPPSRLSAQIAGSLAPISSLVLNLVEQNRVLREARDLLLPRLVSGELDVSELNLDGAVA